MASPAITAQSRRWKVRDVHFGALRRLATFHFIFVVVKACGRTVDIDCIVDVDCPVFLLNFDVGLLDGWSIVRIDLNIGVIGLKGDREFSLRSV